MSSQQQPGENELVRQLTCLMEQHLYAAKHELGKEKINLETVEAQLDRTASLCGMIRLYFDIDEDSSKLLKLIDAKSNSNDSQEAQR